MYEICPKCQYQRQPTDSADEGTCPACGIIFSKWLKQKVTPPTQVNTSNTVPENYSLYRQISNQLLFVEPETEPLYFYGRLFLFAGFALWGWYFISLDVSINPFEINNSFMHNINLVFHEAGHVLFRPFGWFMTILGGSLFQLLMPLIVMLTFIIVNQDNFAASISLWWLGQSMLDLAPYIDDALEQKMVLLGGHTGADAPGNHDWNNILIEFNRLEKCHDYAGIAEFTGTLLILTALAWGGFILYRQFQYMK